LPGRRLLAEAIFARWKMGPARVARLRAGRTGAGGTGRGAVRADAGAVKSLKRYLLGFLTLLSLAWLAAVAVAWARSYSVQHHESVGFEHYFRNPPVQWEVKASRGVLFVEHRRVRPHPPWGDLAFAERVTQLGPRWLRLKRVEAVAWRREPGQSPNAPPAATATFPDHTSWQLWCDFWLLAAVSAPLPGVWLARRFRSARRRAQGVCRRCGYDLRATPGRCPECGAPAAPSQCGEGPRCTAVRGRPSRAFASAPPATRPADGAGDRPACREVR
jgi:hypothetical protein